MRPLTVVHLIQTSNAAPSQWEGLLDTGEAIYIRYRYGKLTVGVGPDILAAVKNMVWSREHGGPLGAHLTYDALRMATHGAVIYDCLPVPDGLSSVEAACVLDEISEIKTLPQVDNGISYRMLPEGDSPPPGATFVTYDRALGGDPVEARKHATEYMTRLLRMGQ